MQVTSPQTKSRSSNWRSTALVSIRMLRGVCFFRWVRATTRWAVWGLGLITVSFPGLARDLTISWSDNSSNETGFVIERSTDGDSYAVAALVAENVTKFTDRNLLRSATYWYRVRAFNDHGFSAYSNIASGTTSGALDPLPSPSEPSPGPFSNVSVRASHGMHNASVVAGFVVNGAGSNQFLIRGVGPALEKFGVSGFLADPQISLHQRAENGISQKIHANDDWGLSAHATDIEFETTKLGAFGLTRGSKDSALLVDLTQGQYTVHVADEGGTVGASLVEVYDAPDNSPGEGSLGISNISVRSELASQDDVVIMGFVIGGVDLVRLLIRAVGSELERFGILHPASNPGLRLFRSSGVKDTLVASNGNWEENGQTVSVFAEEHGAFSLSSGSESAAIEVWLAPGVYTAQAHLESHSTGEVLVEVYAAN